MLRILLIILVALAVIIGLMRLTGARSGDAAPAATTGETIEEGAIDPAPATEDVIVDEPAVDSLDVPADLEGETSLETVETGVIDAGEAPLEAPPIEPLPEENAATPVEPAPDAAAPPAGEAEQPPGL